MGTGNATSEIDVLGAVQPGGARPSRGRQAAAIIVGVVLVMVGGLAGVLGVMQHRVTSHLEYIDDPFDALTNRPTETGTENAPGDADPMKILLRTPSADPR